MDGIKNDLDLDEYKIIKDILHKQHTKHGRKWIACLDVDGTAHQDGISGSQLQQIIASGLWGLVYVTDATIGHICYLITKGELPIPHAAVTNNGTERYYIHNNAINKPFTAITSSDFIQDQSFRKKLKQTSHYCKQHVIELIESIMPQLNATYPFSLRFPDSYDNRKRDIWIKQDEFWASFLFTIPSSYQNHDLINSFIAELKMHSSNYSVQIHKSHENENGDSHWYVSFSAKSPLCGKKAMITDMIHVLNPTGGLIAGNGVNDIDHLFADYGTHAPLFPRLIVGGAEDELLQFIHSSASGSSNTNKSNKKKKIPPIIVESHPDRIGPQSLVYFMEQLEDMWQKRMK